MEYKLCSLFDGSGGFPLAATMCGIKPVYASEVEPYPIAVTKSRFPSMKHLGDVSKVNGADIEPVDVITFGSPCQDLSVAGKRAGLKHEENGDDETTRSGLFMEAIRIIKEMRKATNGMYPTFAIWENVPGAFSSNKGEDFRVVLEEFIKIVEPGATVPPAGKGGWAYADCYVGDGWSLAYRVFDAQYWGVPQRRRRIYLVADFRGGRAAEVLFEREGLRGNPETGRTPWQRATGNAEGSIDTADRAGNCLTPWDTQNRRVYDTDGVFPTLPSREQSGQNQQAVCIPIAFTQNQRNEVRNLGNKAGSLQAQPGMKQQTFICAPICMATQQGGAEIRTDDKAPTITAAAGMSGNNQPVVCYPTKAAGFKAGQSMAGGIGWQEECAATLSAQASGTEPTVMVKTICFEPGIAKRDGADNRFVEEKCTTLRANMGDNQPAVCIKEQYLFENHSQDSRYKGPLDICPIVSATFGMGGNNQPFVVEQIQDSGGKCYVLTDAIPIHDQATRFSGKRGDKSDGKGNGLGVGTPGEPMNTLTSGDRHAVAYCVGHGQAASITMAEISNALNCMHDQQAVIYKQVCVQNTGQGWWNEGDVAATLRTPCGGDSTKANLVCCAAHDRYIVRRLTPTECARLQGFPDEWGHPDHKDALTDEEYRFWHDVRNTHAAINGKTTREYTKSQILTWYNKLHTDSSEYKMWGNGIALPNALYVMQGIADALQRQ